MNDDPGSNSGAVRRALAHAKARCARRLSVVARTLKLIVIALSASTSSAPASAAEIAPAVLAAGCGACHGPAGKSPGAIPSIDALGVGNLRAALLAYKKGELQSTVMTRIAKGFTDNEIEALAQYFGKTKP